MIRGIVTVIGLGGIGSWVVDAVARAGCSRLVLCDPDIVEAHNLENQNYQPRDIKLLKTEATRGSIERIREWHVLHGRDMTVHCIPERIGAESSPCGIVVVAVDTVEARREIFFARPQHPPAGLGV